MFICVNSILTTLSETRCYLPLTERFSDLPNITWVGFTWVAQTVKYLPAMWETWVRSLGQEDPLEKEMATHSSILAWRIPGTEEPGGLLSVGSHGVRHD